MLLAGKIGLGIASLLGLGTVGLFVHKSMAAKVTVPQIPGGVPGYPPIAPPSVPLTPSDPTPTVTITPPGVTQPPTAIINPPIIAQPTDPLQTAAAALMLEFNSNGVPTDPTTADPLVLQFQQLFNNEQAGIPLGTDGIYGAKCQAGLQSVIYPAVAPTALIPDPSTGVVAPVAVPVTPAAPPDPSAYVAGTDSDLTDAANAILNAAPISQGSQTLISTFQDCWNQYMPSQPLIVDGEYGGNSQNAVQSVFNYVATDPAIVAAGGVPVQAPQSAYSAPTSPVPVFNA